MYLGIDIGGTKTLIASLNDDGIIQEETKHPTSKSYNNWLLELRHSLVRLKNKDFRACGVGLPATVLDRKNGLGVRFNNLPWENVHIRDDVARITNSPVVIENDAKMGALSEYMILKDLYSKVLYVTISTGIGFGLVVNGVIDDSLGDSGGSEMFFEFNGKRASWESFASGHAIVKRFHKEASEITDKKTWKVIARNISVGLLELIAIMEPDVIVIGGSVGAHMQSLQGPLEEELNRHASPMLKIPPIQPARRPEKAVVYGCYDLVKATFPDK